MTHLADLLTHHRRRGFDRPGVQLSTDVDLNTQAAENGLKKCQNL